LTDQPNQGAASAEWLRAGVDVGQIVREFTKRDDQPA
jgi:hypothetical protein